ncbi:hypothetical protein SAMN05216226_102105 [Halovenus aranensis]|jgi:hypothetical protein|uniref:Rubrerythrin n=1 Tax=Halovenus aranensis TaxID=890420 RepID=A0A1G8SQY5_9EURY|nr:rubrerythrin [Halovenus aranensis]SDJ31656.1 hypothetical protein SAMN05216226_102105 [Halovenus aranensis]
MSVQTPVSSDHQLARLLQIGVVLEEVVEARAAKHAKELEDIDDDIRGLLTEAAEESADHRERIEALVEGLDAETIPFGEIQTLVEQRYESDQDFDGVLYDQLCNEETAYKFYDDLIEAIEASEAEFSIDRSVLLDELASIREEEETGVEEVTTLMEERE